MGLDNCASVNGLAVAKLSGACQPLDCGWAQPKTGGHCGSTKLALDGDWRFGRDGVAADSHQWVAGRF